MEKSVLLLAISGARLRKPHLQGDRPKESAVAMQAELQLPGELV